MIEIHLLIESHSVRKIISYVTHHCTPFTQLPERCWRSRSRSLNLTRALCRLTSCMLRRRAAIWSRSYQNSSKPTRSCWRPKQIWKYVHVAAEFLSLLMYGLHIFMCVIYSFAGTLPECVCLPKLCSAGGVTVPGTCGTTEYSTKA